MDRLDLRFQPLSQPPFPPAPQSTCLGAALMFARRATAVAYLIGLLTVTQGLGAEPPQEEKVTVHGQRERGTAIWRVSPPHNVADLSEFVMANSCAATLRGGGHLTPRERLPWRAVDGH